LSDINWTDQQRAAILSRGGSLLVSAGAGSGKTYVLVQRLLSYVLSPSEPHNVDDFLVITYTRAAAAELKSRIAEELTKALAADPGNHHLRKQMYRIHAAKIGTAHSYCSSLLREFSGRLGIDPSFRIMDEDDTASALTALTNRLLDERYDTADPDFLLLVDTIGNGRDDSLLLQSVISLYGKLQSLPDVKLWIDEKRNNLSVDDSVEFAETEWGKSLIDSLCEFARAAIELIESLLEEIRGAGDIEQKYSPALEADRRGFGEFLRAVRNSATWGDIAGLCRLEFPPFKPVRNPSDPDLKERVSDIRKAYRERWRKKCAVFEIDIKQIAGDINVSSRVLRELLSLTADLSERYDSYKRERNLMDYSDLEHRSLQLLTGPDGLSDTAHEISSRFIEVLVDEYQDTNEIQDRIFHALSDGGTRLFMVGDVKQSIYRFRLAEPEIFLNKYDTYPDYRCAGDRSPRRISLNANFRSDPGVLAFVNRVFGSVMTRRLGGVDYTEDEALRSPRTQEASVTAAEIDILDTKDLCDDDGTPVPREEAEAAFTAARIRDILGSGFTVTENDVRRPVRAGDIAILLRSDKPVASVYSQALARLGIASATSARSDVLSSPEVSLLLSLLRIIDNPRQDIPLVSVLNSPLFGFTIDELAAMRLNEKEGCIFDALKANAESDPKCAGFLDKLTRLRELARIMQCDELIWQIFCETGLPDIYGAMDGGESRRANLNAIYSFASRCAEKNRRDLFSFLIAVDNAVKGGIQFLRGDQGSDSDAVKIMSIHRSKGLEFPIVFLCDAARRFNTKDVESSLLTHKTLGLASRCVDVQNMVSYDTLPRIAIRDAILSEQLSEEMRVLYVALTRAKHKICITVAGSRVRTMLSRFYGTCDKNFEVIKPSGSMGEWILTALSQHLASEDKAELSTGACAGPEFMIRYISSDSLPPFLSGKKSASILVRDIKSASEDQIRSIRKILEWRYPYAAACDIPSKLTATQLKGRYSDAEAATGAPLPLKRSRMERPRFIADRSGLSPSEIGTAMHLVMQHIDFSKCTSYGGVAGEIERLVTMEQLTPEQAESVDPNKILRFFGSDIGRILLQGRFTLREFKFSILCRAGEYYKDAPAEDEILLQGVVDICIEAGDGMIVLDFKTDRIRPGEEQERANTYAGQLHAYASALKRITGKRVSRLLLYFFETGCFAEVGVQENNDLT
jgi:ATP-dependent helicase/nuclease subunit A